MSDVDIKFEREQISGIVAVDTCLADVARRFGIRFYICEADKSGHKCVWKIEKGSELLSPLSKIETEHFAANGRSSNERLACEASIIKPGEIVIMTAKTTEEPKKSASSNDPFQEEFNALPLDKKFARLFQMEVATLNETFSYVAKSSREAFEKVSEAFVDFGEKVECEAKKATSPSDPKPSADAPKAASPKAKTAGKRKPAAPRKPKI